MLDVVDSGDGAEERIVLAGVVAEEGADGVDDAGGDPRGVGVLGQQVLREWGPEGFSELVAGDCDRHVSSPAGLRPTL